MPEKAKADGPGEVKKEAVTTEPRIGVYVCNCGGNIGDVVDCQKVAESLSKLPDVKPSVIYDPEFSSGRYGVYVEAPAERLDEARKILNAQEPAELREGTEAAHA